MSKLTQLQERRTKKVTERDNVTTKLLEALKARTSKTIGCKGCGSKIAKDRLVYLACPVCGVLLVSPTVKNRLDKLYAAIGELEKGIQELGGTFS